ncbi:hypothetical protein [Metabacillus indicus]|uniref:hypothetical protein n=1 Tax=Metabacillus indicus TaxID=246786 RepID=UPI003CF115C6
MGVELTLIHWVYILFIISIVGFMILKSDTTVISMIGIIPLTCETIYNPYIEFLSHKKRTLFSVFLI